MYILFDIGGTNFRIGVSKTGRKIDQVEALRTPKNFKKAIDKFEEAALKLSDGKKIKAITGGIAGPLDKKKTKVINAPSLKALNDKPFAGELRKRFKCPVCLENDADLAGLGEARFGGGKGNKIVAYFTVSTGIGGTRIVNGKIDENVMGFEPGHQYINFKDKAGHLEGYASGTAIRRRFKKEPAGIEDKKIWNQVAYWLALGLNNSIVHWSPDIIVLGGSVMKSLPISLVKKSLKKAVKIFPKIPPVKKAKLGDLSGLYGALAIIRNK